MRVREARPDEFDALGRLLVDVYARLESFPGPQLQPRYYALLAGSVHSRPNLRHDCWWRRGRTCPAAWYFGDFAHYGSGGAARTLTSASGIRLLGVALSARAWAWVGR